MVIMLVILIINSSLSLSKVSQFRLKFYGHLSVSIFTLMSQVRNLSHIAVLWLSQSHRIRKGPGRDSLACSLPVPLHALTSSRIRWWQWWLGSGAPAVHTTESLYEQGSPHPGGTQQHQELRLEKCSGSLFVCPKPGLLPFSLYPLVASCLAMGKTMRRMRNLVWTCHVWDVFPHVTGDAEKESRLEISI